jgi:hypothetical protein
MDPESGLPGVATVAGDRGVSFPVAGLMRYWEMAPVPVFGSEAM